jgi:hypothetical protein
MSPKKGDSVLGITLPPLIINLSTNSFLLVKELNNLTGYSPASDPAMGTILLF